MRLHISRLHFHACYPYIYIQLGNIILDENNVAQLIDFLVSMSIPEGQLPFAMEKEILFMSSSLLKSSEEQHTTVTHFKFFGCSILQGFFGRSLILN